MEEIEPERGALDLVLVAQLFRVRVRVRDREAPVRRGRVGALGGHEDRVVPGPPAVARVEDRPEPVGVDEMAEPVRLVGCRAGRRGRKPDQAVVTADVVVARELAEVNDRVVAVVAARQEDADERAVVSRGPCLRVGVDESEPLDRRSERDAAEGAGRVA